MRKQKEARPFRPRLLLPNVQHLVVTIAVAKGTHRSRSDPARFVHQKELQCDPIIFELSLLARPQVHTIATNEATHQTDSALKFEM